MQVGLDTPQVEWAEKFWYQLLKKVAVHTVEVPPGTEVYYTDRKKLDPFTPVADNNLLN